MSDKKQKQKKSCKTSSLSYKLGWLEVLKTMQKKKQICFLFLMVIIFNGKTFAVFSLMVLVLIFNEPGGKAAPSSCSLASNVKIKFYIFQYKYHQQ